MLAQATIAGPVLSLSRTDTEHLLNYRWPQRRTRNVGKFAVEPKKSALQLFAPTGLIWQSQLIMTQRRGIERTELALNQSPHAVLISAQRDMSSKSSIY